MATYKGRNNTSIQASPAELVKVKELGGRMRVMYDDFTMGTTAGLIGDVIQLGKLPKGAKVYWARVNIETDDFGAGVTFNVGHSAGLNNSSLEAADADSIVAALAGSALSANQYINPASSAIIYKEFADEVYLTATVAGANFDTANPTAKLSVMLMYTLD
jgi:hypothetical protein